MAFGIPAIRKRYYIVGTRKDNQFLNDFRMPQKGVHNKVTLAKLLPGVQHDVADSDLNFTELRNWNKIKEQLQAKMNLNSVEFPVIGDFHMSESFGTSWQEQKSPTITKTRARGEACFLYRQAP